MISIQSQMDHNQQFINYLKEHHAETYEDLYNKFEDQCDKCPICLNIVSKDNAVNHNGHTLACEDCFPKFIKSKVDTTLEGEEKWCETNRFIEASPISCVVCRGDCNNKELEKQFQTIRGKKYYGEMIKMRKINCRSNEFPDDSIHYFFKVKQGKKMATYERHQLNASGGLFSSKHLKFNRTNPPTVGSVITFRKEHNFVDKYIVV